MIDDVKSGKFLPDSTRSGRFPLEVNDDTGQRDEAKSDASSSSSDGSDNESELDFENEEKAIQGVIGKWDPGTPELDLENARFARQSFAMHSCDAG